MSFNKRLKQERKRAGLTIKQVVERFFLQIPKRRRHHTDLAYWRERYEAWELGPYEPNNGEVKMLGEALGLRLSEAELIARLNWNNHHRLKNQRQRSPGPRVTQTAC